MTIRYDRPVSHAAYLSCRLGQFSFLLFVVVLVAHRFGLMITPYFVALVLLSVAFAALAILFAAVGLMRLWQVAAKGGGAAVKGLVYSLPPLLLFRRSTISPPMSSMRRHGWSLPLSISCGCSGRPRWGRRAARRRCSPIRR